MDTDVIQPALKVWVMSMNRHVTTDVSIFSPIFLAVEPSGKQWFTVITWLTYTPQEIVRGLNKIEEEETRKFCLNKPTRDECISMCSFSVLAVTGAHGSISLYV